MREFLTPCTNSPRAVRRTQGCQSDFQFSFRDLQVSGCAQCGLPATHRNLEAPIQEQQFRRDLFYGLRVVTITTPPLDVHPEDIPESVKYFLKRYSGAAGVTTPSIQPEAIAFVQIKSWPGNVRELENTVRQALPIAKDFTITVDHVREVLAKYRQPVAATEQSHAAYI